MTSKIYVKILKTIIKLQLNIDKDFILEEDNNTSYNSNKATKTNIARIQKEDYLKLKYYTNISYSSDLALVKRIQLFIKEKVNTQDHFDKAILIRLCKEAQELIPQATINRICGEWYDDLIKVIWREGKMSRY